MRGGRKGRRKGTGRSHSFSPIPRSSPGDGESLYKKSPCKFYLFGDTVPFPSVRSHRANTHNYCQCCFVLRPWKSVVFHARRLRVFQLLPTRDVLPACERSPPTLHNHIDRLPRHVRLIIVYIHNEREVGYTQLVLYLHVGRIINFLCIMQCIYALAGYVLL